MLDLKYIRENAEAVQENSRNRGVEADVELVVEGELRGMLNSGTFPGGKWAERRHPLYGHIVLWLFGPMLTNQHTPEGVRITAENEQVASCFEATHSRTVSIGSLIPTSTAYTAIRSPWARNVASRCGICSRHGSHQVAQNLR